MTLTEEEVEELALEIFEEMGYNILLGPDIFPRWLKFL